jgi:hypothetical protein
MSNSKYSFSIPGFSSRSTNASVVDLVVSPERTQEIEALHPIGSHQSVIFATGKNGQQTNLPIFAGQGALIDGVPAVVKSVNRGNRTAVVQTKTDLRTVSFSALASARKL